MFMLFFTLHILPLPFTLLRFGHWRTI